MKPKLARPISSRPSAACNYPIYCVSIQLAKEKLTKRLSQEYSTSTNFHYLQIINSIVQKRKKTKICIKENDIKFYCKDKQNIQKYYIQSEMQVQFPQLLEYYKYYTQNALCFFAKDYSFLAVQHERKKTVLYQKLKKQLNLSCSQDIVLNNIKLKTPVKYQSVLAGITLTQRSQDESYMIEQILKKLTNFYGPSQNLAIQKIDKDFKLMKHNKNVSKAGIKKSQNSTEFNSNFYLQSTNNSASFKNKKSKNKNQKNQIHRRFASCEQIRETFSKRTSQLIRQKKKSSINRRRSMQNISNCNSSSTYNISQWKKSKKYRNSQLAKQGYQPLKANFIPQYKKNSFYKAKPSNKLKTGKQNNCKQQPITNFRKVKVI